MGFLKQSEDEEMILNQDIIDMTWHGICVSNIAYNLSKELKLKERHCCEMALAGMLHDIGKLKLAKYLYGRKDNVMEVEQMRYARMHSQLGYNFLKSRNLSEFILESILYHHENYDGSGYPGNIVGEDIPIGARIIRVSDVFSALISDRPYRAAFDVDTAVEMMIEENKNFDMAVFLAFQRIIHEEKVLKIINRG